MAYKPIPPYPKNAPGPFYVENECCIACEAPYHEAPDLIAHDDEGSYPHCYFQKQPETPEEVERAIMACRVSCVEAVRYGGNDPKILARFRELRSDSSCDALAQPPPAVQESPRPQPRPVDPRHPLWDRDLDG